MSEQSIELQLLAAAEWPLWRKLRLQALREAPYAFSSKLADWQGAADLEERWRDRLTTVPFNLIATIAGDPVGMVSATEIDPNGTMELISLWVAPSGRGLGVGEALIAAVIQWSRQQKAERVSLDVRTGNHQAIALYVRKGFVDAGESPLTNPDGVSERRFVYECS